MTRYMMVMMIDGEMNASFSDSYSEISQRRMDASCGLGAYAEVYERVYIEDEGYEYRLLEA